MVKCAYHLIRRVRRVQIDTNRDLKRVAVSVAGVEDNVCDCCLFLFLVLVK